MAAHYNQNYEEGWKFWKNGEIQSAILCWEKAAAQGHALAMYSIGETYDHLLNDFFKAREWYWKAIRNQNTNALVAIAIWYRYGRFVKKNVRSAILFYERAARCGNDMAMLELQELYYFGDGVKKNYTKSLYWLKRSAVLGNDLAIDSLVGRYLEGFGGTKKDFSLALFWYQKLADYDIANDRLADLYFFGEQYDKNSFRWQYDFKTKTYWLDVNIRGMILLDIFDAENQNISQALYWYRQFAQRGNIVAIKKLEYLYRHGLIVMEDQELAKYWSDFAKATEARHKEFLPE